MASPVLDDLSSAQITVLRTFFLYDYYDASGTPIKTGNAYNRVHKTTFFTDADLQRMLDQVLLENPKVLQDWTDASDNEQPPMHEDPETAMYRFIRRKAFQQMLLSHDYIKSMLDGNSPMEAVETVLVNMREAIKDDMTYATNTGQFPGSIVLQRA